MGFNSVFKGLIWRWTLLTLGNNRVVRNVMCCRLVQRYRFWWKSYCCMFRTEEFWFSVVPSMGWSSTRNHASENRDLISAALRTSSLTSSTIFGWNPRDMLFVNGSSHLKLLQLENLQQIHLLILKSHSISTLCLSFQSSTTSFSSLLQFLSERQQTRGFLFIVR